MSSKSKWINKDELSNEDRLDLLIEQSDALFDGQEEEESKIKLRHISEFYEGAQELLKNWGTYQGLITSIPQVDNLTKGLVGGELIVVAGETCLHPKTPIFDPTDNTNYTVEDRFALGRPFHVYALDGDKIIITEADPPDRYYKTQMWELSNGEHSITVTPEHRVWTGSTYEHVSRLLESDAIHLPTISEHDFLRLHEDAQHCSYKDEGSRFGCHPLCRLCGQLLPGCVIPYRGETPSPTDVHEHIREHYSSGGLVCEPIYNHSYLGSDRPSSCSDSPSCSRHHEDVFRNHFQVTSSLSSFQTHESQSLSGSCCNPSPKESDIEKVCGRPTRKGSHPDCLEVSSYTNLSKWGVKRQTDGVYYDFNVPRVHNYYASGLFHHNSHGKTLLAINMAVQLAKQNINTLFVTMEMTKEQLTARAMKAANISTLEELQALPIVFQDTDEMNWKLIDPLIAEAKKDEVACVFIDHLHYFTRELNNVAEDLGRITKEFKKNSIRHDIPIVLISHVRKKGTGQKAKAGNDELRGSSYIAQDADVVLFVKRESEKLTEITITKNRNRGFNPDLDTLTVEIEDGARIKIPGEARIKSPRGSTAKESPEDKSSINDQQSFQQFVDQIHEKG